MCNTFSDMYVQKMYFSVFLSYHTISTLRDSFTTRFMTTYVALRNSLDDEMQIIS